MVFFLYLLSVWAAFRDVLGPFFAAFTNFPRLIWVRTRRAHELRVALRNQFGPLVRLGPHMVSTRGLQLKIRMTQIGGDLRGDFAATSLTRRWIKRCSSDANLCSQQADLNERMTDPL